VAVEDAADEVEAASSNMELEEKGWRALVRLVEEKQNPETAPLITEEERARIIDDLARGLGAEAANDAAFVSEEETGPDHDEEAEHLVDQVVDEEDSAFELSRGSDLNCAT
jgi:hypothetical protein